MAFRSKIHEAHYRPARVERWHRVGIVVAALNTVHEAFPVRLHQVEECSREQISNIRVVEAHRFHSELEATLEVPVG